MKAGLAFPYRAGQTTSPTGALGAQPLAQHYQTQAQYKLHTPEPPFPTREMKMTTSALPLPSPPDPSGRRAPQMGPWHPWRQQT